MDSEQQARLAYNESRFREINDQVTARLGEFRGGGDAGSFSVVCECALPDCTMMVELLPEQYRHVRSSDRWFVVTPEHVVVDVEFVHERHETHWVIQKVGTGGDLAERLA